MAELRPIGHRVLVRPDRPPTETASGFLIPEAIDIPPMSGTVIAVGDGPRRAFAVKHGVVRRCLAIVDACGDDSSLASRVREALQQYDQNGDDIERLVVVGDRVIFAPESGHDIVVGEQTDDRVLVLAEDDILAVVA